MLSRQEFDRVWDASVAQMRRSFTLGSIVTVRMVVAFWPWRHYLSYICVASAKR